MCLPTTGPVSNTSSFHNPNSLCMEIYLSPAIVISYMYHISSGEHLIALYSRC